LFVAFIALAACAYTNVCGKNKPCPSGQCCSYWGYCGSSSAYCGSGSKQCVCDCNGKNPCVVPDNNNNNTNNTKEPVITLKSVDDYTFDWVADAKDGVACGKNGKSIIKFRAKLNTGNLYYRTHIKNGGWAAEKNNWAISAGRMDGLMIKTDLKDYKVFYQVHIKGGNWLPEVTGYSPSDSNNGYAGILGREIDQVKARIVSTAGPQWINYGTGIATIPFQSKLGDEYTSCCLFLCACVKAGVYDVSTIEDIRKWAVNNGSIESGSCYLNKNSSTLAQLIAQRQGTKVNEDMIIISSYICSVLANASTIFCFAYLEIIVLLEIRSA